MNQTILGVLILVAAFLIFRKLIKLALIVLIIIAALYYWLYLR